MIISFLYFIELCHGKTSKTDTEYNQKIVVIDDPVSSLSHNHIFNIAQLIRKYFGNENFEQVFILTHSLYFFNEIDKVLSEKQYARIQKTTKGSIFTTMKANEILNEYQAYWSIIRDDKNIPPVILANTMRNILEYFFGFINEKSLKEIFKNTTKLQNIKYQAFIRYINRESHSDMANIFDINDFDYNLWKVVFCDVFKASGHEEHYNMYMHE